jgi:hypothetical protein
VWDRVVDAAQVAHEGMLQGVCVCLARAGIVYSLCGNDTFVSDGFRKKNRPSCTSLVGKGSKVKERFRLYDHSNHRQVYASYSSAISRVL